MTREEIIKSRKAGIEESSSSYAVWTTDESLDITLDEHIKYNCPAMKRMIGNPYIFKVTYEKDGKKLSFLKCRIATPGRVWSFELSWNKDNAPFSVDDELDPSTVLFRREYCEVEDEETGEMITKTHDYIWGEVL